MPSLQDIGADERYLLDGQKLARVLTQKLGPNGWQIRDWQRTRKQYVAKIYTEWGWAGFCSGTANQIAADLFLDRKRADPPLLRRVK